MAAVVAVGMLVAVPAGAFGAADSDVNGDNRSDLVALHSNGTVYTYLGRPDGYFWSPVSSFAGTMAPALWTGAGHHVIDVADVHGDGMDDLITLGSNGNVYVYAGQPNGTFLGNAQASFNGTMTPAVHGATAGGYTPIGVAEVTPDGKADLVVLNQNGTVYLYEGLATGYFAGPRGSFSGTMDPGMFDGQGFLPIDLADVTGDGLADLVTQHTNGNLYTYPGTPSGFFSTSYASFSGSMNPAMPTGSGFEPVGLGDVDGDGYADLVTLHTNGTVYVYRGQSSAYFVNPVVARTGIPTSLFGYLNGHEAITVMDVTGDGRADLLTHQAGHVLTLPGLPHGGFGESSTSFNGTYTTARYNTGAGYEAVMEKPARRRRGCAPGGCTGPVYPTSVRYGGANGMVDTAQEASEVFAAMGNSSAAGAAALWNGLRPEDQPAVANVPTEEVELPATVTDAPIDADAAAAGVSRCKTIKNPRLVESSIFKTDLIRYSLSTTWCYRSNGSVYRIYAGVTDHTITTAGGAAGWHFNGAEKKRASCYGGDPERCAWTYEFFFSTDVRGFLASKSPCATNQVRGDGGHYRHGSCDLGTWSGPHWGGA